MIFKRFKKKFEVILFKSHKDKSFYDSPEPSCLRNCPVLWDWVHGLWNKLSRFRVLITWALERHYSLPPPLGPQQSLLKIYLRIHEFYDVFLAWQEICKHVLLLQILGVNCHVCSNLWVCVCVPRTRMWAHRPRHHLWFLLLQCEGLALRLTAVF